MGKLTVKELEALTLKDVGRKLFDGEGLYGRVLKQKTGIVVAFEYRFTLQGKERTTACGKWPSEILKNIREIRYNKKKIVEDGRDPIELNKGQRLQVQVDQAQAIERQKAELKRLATEVATQRTLTHAITQWQKLELSKRKDGGKESLRAINKDILPVLGNIALTDIKRAMIMNILDTVIDRGSRVMANHLFADLKQFFNFAVAREWVEAHPLAGLTKDKIGGRQKERDRYLSEAEIRELKKRLPAANLLQTTEIAIWILLSTCSRVGELSQARWTDVDIETGKWTIPAGNSKNAKEHTIFLSAFALERFKALKTITGTTGWCLPFP